MSPNYWKPICLLLALFSLHCNVQSAAINDNSIPTWTNDRPIIGILSQRLTTSMAAKFPDKKSYIAASYVKYVEGAGARAIPIRVNQPQEYYIELFNSINGLLIPGGGDNLKNSSYAKTGGLFYKWAMAASENGDHFPIWGTCLGFELLTVITAGDSYLTSCKSSGRALPLTFRSSAKTSRLYGNAPEEILDTLANSPSTSNFHIKCLTPANFTASGLDQFYDISATSEDDNGLTFVASIEAKNYPFWGTQFHPEKNMYEWQQPSIPHSARDVAAGQYFAKFLVAEARKSQHSFSSSTEEDKYLIYKDQPVFTRNITTSFEQCYFFD